MQSLSHQDSEKVFGENFLFVATFIFYFTLYPTIFHAKKLSSSNLLKKKFFWFHVVHTFLPLNSPASPYKLKKSIFPPNGLEKGHNGNNPDLSARK